MRHDLRIQHEYLCRLESGHKTCEVRSHDRDYQVGDSVTFEYVGTPGLMGAFTPCPIPGHADRSIFAEAVISHVLTATQFEGVAEGYCVLSLVSPAQWEALP